MQPVQQVLGAGGAHRQAGGQLGDSPHGLLNGPTVLGCLRDVAVLCQLASIQQLVGQQRQSMLQRVAGVAYNTMQPR